MIRQLLFLFFLFAVGAIYTEAFRGSACADDININTEWDYSHTRSKTDSGNGKVSSSTIDDFLQQYTLTVRKTLFPNLTFFASGNFQEDQTKSKVDTVETTSKAKIFQPLVTLTLNSSPYSAVLTYNRLQITTNSTGFAPQTVINNNYSGLFTFKPAGLPELDFTGQRTETYDAQRVFQNTLVNRFLAGSKFSPIKNLDLSYQFTYNDSKDKLQNTDSTQISNEGRFIYWHSFFNNRVSLSADGDISRQDTTASIGAGSNGLQVKLFPNLGLYAADSTADSPLGVDLPPHTPANDAMKSDITQSLINGGDFIGNVGKLNIGFPQTNPADNNPRVVGVGFSQPTEVDSIWVTVNQDVNSIATSYSWDVYISSDPNIGQGVNPTATQQWTLYQPAATFIFSQIDRTFRITFQKATTQFIKVVTRPLPVPAAVAGVDVNNILVSQIQAFRTETSSQAAKFKTTTTSQTYNLNVRTRILDSPTLYYDMSAFYSSTANSGSGFIVGQPSQTIYIITNGLSGAYKFNPVFSANARVAREDSYGLQGTGVAYIGNVSLTAVPLRTVTDSLVFSKRNEELGGKPNDTSSVFLTNLAQLYQGVNVSISGGLIWSTSTSLQENKSEVLTSTLSLAPYKVLTINADYSWTNSRTTGGGAPDLQTTSTRSDITFTYTPFPTLSLFGSYGVFSGVNVQQTTLTSYGTNWSPFPDGTLLFNFSYTQNLSSLNSTKDTLLVPSLRWNISKYAFMTISYLVFKSQSIVASAPQRTSQETLNSILHLTF
jgi:hypothetical protein